MTDLNDFITPAQACIKPVEQVKSTEVVKEPGSASASHSNLSIFLIANGKVQTEIMIDSAGSYYEVEEVSKAGRKLEQAQISLNDCLACRYDLFPPLPTPILTPC